MSEKTFFSRMVSRLRAFKIVFIILFLIVVFNSFSVWFFTQWVGNRVIKPSLYLNDRQNEVLRNLRVIDRCEPLPCANTYLVMTGKKQLNNDFKYCNYAGISGNVYIYDKDYQQIANFGSNNNCGFSYNEEYQCQSGHILTSYTFYQVFPCPRKVETVFYSCD